VGASDISLYPGYMTIENTSCDERSSLFLLRCIMRKKIRDSLPFRALGLVGEENLLPTWSRLDGIESGATR
jgi:hypothetical protein